MEASEPTCQERAKPREAEAARVVKAVQVQYG